MFYMMSLLLYIWARKCQVDAKENAQERIASEDFFPRQIDKKPARFGPKVLICYFLSLCFGVFALFCKENAATLFGVILLFEYFLFDRTWRGWKKKLIWLAPMGLVLAFLVLYFFATTRGLRFGNLLEDVSILTRETRGIDRWSYLCTQFSVLVIYVRLLFFPVGQNVDYMYPFKTGFFDGLTPLAFLFVAAVFLVGIWNIKKKSAVSFGIFWFFITLSIESSIFTISDAMFEHRLYLPMFGFAISVVYLAFDLLASRRGWAVLFLTTGIAALGTATYLRNQVWQDPLVLWTDVASKSPHNYRAHYNLANAMQRRGQLDAAIKHYESALRISPGFAVAHENFGLALMDMGKRSEGLLHLREAVRKNPRSANAQNSLGQALLIQGRMEEATGFFRRAIAINRRYVKAYNNLGISLAQQGKLKDAVEQLLKAVALAPQNSQIHNNAGQALMMQGENEKAADHFSETIRLDPEFAEAHMNLGLVLNSRGDYSGATHHFLAALKINPQLEGARVGLNKALRFKNRGGPNPGPRIR